MRHMNYNHLLYFWTVAREGSIARASRVLHLTPQTVSAQIKQLEQSIGEPLFNRVGRGLVLSEMGSVVMRYADDIFTTGLELNRVLKSGEHGHATMLTVGITDSTAKLVAYRILQPATEEPGAVRLVLIEDQLERLTGSLATHHLDLIISDAPLPANSGVKAWNHHLGHSEIRIFGTPALTRKFRPQFPKSLDGAPFLVPTTGNAVRRVLDDWFEQQGIVPKIIAEIDDSALINAFGSEGAGLFPASAASAARIRKMYGVAEVGTAKGAFVEFYAISPERKIRHPVVYQLCERARTSLFR